MRSYLLLFCVALYAVSAIPLRRKRRDLLVVEPQVNIQEDVFDTTRHNQEFVRRVQTKSTKSGGKGKDSSSSTGSKSGKGSRLGGKGKGASSKASKSSEAVKSGSKSGKATKSGSKSGKGSKSSGTGGSVSCGVLFPCAEASLSLETRPPSPSTSPSTPPPTPSTPAPTPPPSTAAPTVQFPDCSRENVRQQVLAITDEATLSDPASPQAQALAWLLNEDSDVCAGGSVLQRYSLLTLYYSTMGGSWSSMNGWLIPGFSECAWFGVTCNVDSDLTALELENNNLVGSLPSELRALTRSETMNFFLNRLSGTIPEIFTDLAELKIFDVEDNFLIGSAFPSSLPVGSAIESWLVSFNDLTGMVPRNIGPLMPNLRELWLALNNMQGSLPFGLSNLTGLDFVVLYNNSFTGTLPSLPAATRVQIQNNMFSGALPINTFSTGIIELIADTNDFSGTIGDELGTLTNLLDLRLSNNSFTGSLPNSFVALTNLRVFEVDNNNFVGTIRDGFQEWTSLQFADFTGNNFVGTIPSSIFDIPSLLFLYLGGNSLTGTIPPNFSSPPSIIDIFLNNNQLDGTIPPIAMGQLTTLTELLLDTNMLTGSMPSSICDLRSPPATAVLANLTADCLAPAEVECLCCSSCL